MATRNSPPPSKRRLRIFTIDPSADVSLDTAGISRCTLEIPWENLTPPQHERSYPVGEYVEVVDVDPPSGCAYDPVDLDDPHLLAQDGLPPSEGNPQFHQQMAYAVCMKTIENFEQALGRQILWADRPQDADGHWITSRDQRYVGRLRVYPHALRDQNAFYSPAKKSLLLGYFNAPTTDPREELPGGTIFTCLSHDVIAHETTHAILDGINSRLLEATNPDMLAFHEAFADIVAVFQHFTLPGLLLDQIRHTRGSLTSGSQLLSTLAVQFGRATRRGSALRNALGDIEQRGRRLPPDPALLGRTSEPHDRGAILLAAVFDAFVRMYENRICDLRRIATGGTGVLPPGDVHPDLAARFAEEAVTLAQRVLMICVRALDYLPPVDITFGDYLRALITADADLVPDDSHRYRLAFIDAFRQRGIYPADVRALGEDSLRWRRVDDEVGNLLRRLLPPPEVIRTMATAWAYAPADPLLEGDDDATFSRASLKTLDLDQLAQNFLKAYWCERKSEPRPAGWDRRKDAYCQGRQFARLFNVWIRARLAQADFSEEQQAERSWLSWHLGIDLELLQQSDQDPAVEDGRLEVSTVRPVLRRRPDGQQKIELVVILLQKTLVPLAEGLPQDQAAEIPEGQTFKFRGGCTLLIDPLEGQVEYAIGKSGGRRKDDPDRDFARNRREAVAAFLRSQIAALGDSAFDRFPLATPPGRRPLVEPLALLHRKN
ncbi:MAG: hypothetical protein NTY19_46390 [Planctomycetota bacterium]|nr:hypothetical protein [Planctomycetota bacterium]